MRGVRRALTIEREGQVSTPAFANRDVEAVFDAMPKGSRQGALALRSLIFEAAAANARIGRIEETIKWGQPAYLTPDTRSGSTIRIGIPKSDAHEFALFVHCQTDLTRRLDETYPGLFTYEGTRAVLFDTSDTPDREALRHCVGMALTYHLR